MTRTRTTATLSVLVVTLAVLGFVPVGSARADEPPAEPTVTRSITARPVTRSVPYNQPAEVRGVLTDDDPTTGPLAGVEVFLFVNDSFRNDGGDDVYGYYQTRYSTRTDSTGAYRLRWNLNDYPHTFRVSTYPSFGPLRASAEHPVADPGHVNGRALLGHVTTAVRSDARFTVKGGIAPRATPGDTIELYAGRPGEPVRFRERFFLRPGAGVFGRTYRLAPGRWTVRVRYVYKDGRLDSPTYTRSLVLSETGPR